MNFHGIVECLVVVGNKAYIAGIERGTEGPDAVPFELWVLDGGAGAAERTNDMGLVWYGPETGQNEPDQQAPGNYSRPRKDEYCGIEEDPTSRRPNAVLMRGNYQVHDAP